MTTPVRLQLSRRKGFNLQALSRTLNGLPATNCARGRHSRLGNCFVVGIDGDQAACVEKFRRLIMDGEVTPPVDPRSPDAETQRRTLRDVRAALPALRGRNVACWCALDAPCHADVEKEAANA